MNRTICLNDDAVAGLRPAAREYLVRDRGLPAFGVRVRASGHKSYVLMTPGGGRVTIGPARHLGCDAARRMALAHLARVDDGVDNGIDGGSGERGGDGGRSASLPSLAALIAGPWHDGHLMRCKPSSRRAYNGLIRNHILPRFGALPLDGITRAAVADWFDDISRTAPGAANRALILLGQMLNFAVRRGLLRANPLVGLRKNRGRRMTRFLSRAELAGLYHAMDGYVTESPNTARRRGRDIVRLLVLTGCRRNEILHLRWDEVEGGRLRLADGKTGGRIVMLCAAARGILAGLPRGAEAHVFPSRTRPDRPVTSVDCFWRAVRARAGLDDVRLHDLRHTFASHAVMNGVPLPVVARLLGHARIAMTMRYAHIGDDAAEAAAERVGARVAELLDGGDGG